MTESSQRHRGAASGHPDPAARELDRARRIGWARAYEAEAARDELAERLTELEADYDELGAALIEADGTRDELVESLRYTLQAIRIAEHLLASGYAREARYVLFTQTRDWLDDAFADPLLAACQVVERFDKTPGWCEGGERKFRPVYGPERKFRPERQVAKLPTATGRTTP